MTKIFVNLSLSVEESELEERFVLSSGPGGQNVNKVASAVELRFDAARSRSLNDEVRGRLHMLAGRRMTKDGVLVLRGRRFRDQQRNRDDVRARLFDLLARAAVPLKPRKATTPTRASRERLLEAKKARATIKKTRRRPPALD